MRVFAATVFKRRAGGSNLLTTTSNFIDGGCLDLVTLFNHLNMPTVECCEHNSQSEGEIFFNALY